MNFNKQPYKESISIRKEILKALPYIIVIFLVILINKFFIMNITIPSASMENTLNIGDCLFGNRLAYIFSNPKRGDIITFNLSEDDNKSYVKRIIGIEGDTVTINNGRVYLNGELLRETYIKEPMVQDNYNETFKVPKGCVFVMGDNRNNSYDARFWNNHFVEIRNITSKLGVKYLDGTKNKFCFKIIK